MSRRALVWRLLPSHFMLAALLTALTCQGTAQAQVAGTVTETAVKAAFLFKFPGFIEWPIGTVPTTGRPLVIGIAGSDAMAAELEQINQASNGSAMVLRRLREGEDLAGLHVLFIGAARETRVRELTASAQGPVLIVTEQDDGLRLGGIINFVIEGGRVRFTASVPAAEARGLRLSARLLSVARAVEGGR